jgi:quercetin dioxygenase-like cupin family protein
VVGYGLTENRFQRPRLHEPHGLSLAWLSADAGCGVRRHRIQEAQVVIVKSGVLSVTLNSERLVSTELGAYDTLSIPPGAWRSFECVGDEPVQFVVLTEGDGRVSIEWDAAVVAEAEAKDVAIDPNGYLAPASMLNRRGH